MPEQGDAPAPNVDGGVLLGGGADEAFYMALQRSGVLCGACGDVIEDGWEYLGLFPEVVDGRPMITRRTVYLCKRDRCEGFRKRAEQDGAVARRPFRAWELLDPELKEARRVPGGAK